MSYDPYHNQYVPSVPMTGAYCPPPPVPGYYPAPVGQGYCPPPPAVYPVVATPRQCDVTYVAPTFCPPPHHHHHGHHHHGWN